MTHTGLSGQVKHGVELGAVEDCIDGGLVLYTGLNLRKPRMLFKDRKARFFQFDIVIVVQIVDAHNAPPISQQPL